MTGLVPRICEGCLKRLVGAVMDGENFVVYCNHTPPNLPRRGVLLITTRNAAGDSTAFSYLSEAEAKALVQQTLNEEHTHD